jgi:hypothetical protein
MNSKTRTMAISDNDRRPVIKTLSAMRSIRGLSVVDLIEIYDNRLATKKRMIGTMTHSSRRVV